MGIYILLFFIPVLVWVLVTKMIFSHTISWTEMIFQLFFSLLVIGLLMLAGSYGQTKDVMFVNGEIVNLNPKKETCPIGWRSSRDSHCTNYRTRQVYSHTTCTTNSNGKKSCTRHYDTEYKYDYSWERRYFVNADYGVHGGSTYEINRVDSQGVNTPPRFAEIEIGDPATTQVSFTNYIKAAPDSLFSAEPPHEDDVVLAYPSVRDLYKANRVIVSGVEFDSNVWKAWNKSIMEINRDVAPTGANVIVVLTGSGDYFSEMLARAWEAHNLNDVVVTIGTDGQDIEWVDVAHWSADHMVEVELKNNILNHGKLDTDVINKYIADAVGDHFELRSMDEFEYLAEEIKPPSVVIILAVIFLLVGTPAITYLLHRNEIA